MFIFDIIYIFGGGILDVSYVVMDDNSFTMKATYGNQHLGGQNFTNTMVDYFISVVKKKNRKRALDVNPKVIRRLKTTYEEARKNSYN